MDEIRITITQDGGTVYVSSGPANVAIDASDFPSDMGWRAAVKHQVAEFLANLRAPI